MKHYKELSNCKLSYTKAKLHPYGCDKPLSVMGKFSSEVDCEGSLTTARFRKLKIVQLYLSAIY